MQTFNLPDDLVPAGEASMENIYIFPYQSADNSSRSGITLHYNLFSFLLAGEKKVYYAEKHAQINNNQFLMLSSGNCLMSEKMAPENSIYKSVLVFFDNAVLTGFFLKYPHILIDRINDAVSEEPFFVFETDDFLRNFISSLSLMLATGKPVSREMKLLKFEELMLYLAEHYPQEILNLRTSLQENQEDFLIRRSVEANICNNITIEELAFLCNMSVSTFKRRFAKIYGNSPNKWLVKKRMEQAATMLLSHREKPGEIYHKLGYENHSSFTQSFKQVYGITPSEYQQQKLNV